MISDFEWGEKKNRENQEKHAVASSKRSAPSGILIGSLSEIHRIVMMKRDGSVLAILGQAS